MFDAGLHPGHEGEEATPWLRRAGSEPLEAVFLTHAHLDHLGALPLVTRRWNTRVIMSAPTATLCPTLLRNSISIMQKSHEQEGGPVPLYTRRDLKALERSIDVQPVGEVVREQGWCFELRDAGHILGSTSVLLEHGAQRVLYTSDINLRDQTLMRAALLHDLRADVLVMECTRGATPDAPQFTREAELSRLAASLNTVWDRGGVTLLPVFALGKTQEVMMALHLLMCQGMLPQVPFRIGGLSEALTEIYDSWANLPGRNHSGFELLRELRVTPVNGETGDFERPRPRHLYLVSAGMLTEKTGSNLMAQSILPREQDAIFFVGYCDPESPGGRLKATPRGERVTLDDEKGPQPVNCEVASFDLTAHALREDLMGLVASVSPKHVVLVHGDPPALEWFRAEISSRYPGIRVTIPPPGEWVDL